MRRIASAVVPPLALVIFACTGVAFGAAPSPPPASCAHHLRSGQCLVTVLDPGSSGEAGSGSSIGSGDDCTDLVGDRISCDVPGLGYWDDSLKCYLELESPQPPLSSPIWQGHTDGAVYLCTSWPPTTTGSADLWFATPPAGAGPATAALRAERLLTLPQPSGHRSPDESRERDGHPYTYVNLWTWFWTDRATWRPLSATARAGGVSATVTVTPRQLVFDPGDGSRPLSCAGPGRPWTQDDGNDPPSGGGCAYRYTHATASPVTSVQSIDWSVSWSASDGTSGSLPDLTTSQTGPLTVMQIETVVSR